MEKEQYRSVIRFLFLDGKTCEEIKAKLDAVYGNPSPPLTVVRHWFNEFKRGRSSVFDEKRPGRAADVVTEEIVEKNTAKRTTARDTHKPEDAEPRVDLIADHRDLILTANKVFGEGKWSHAVVSQTLDFIEVVGAKCCAGCVSSVRVQLENGNFHEDIGYYSAEESKKGLSIHNARLGSVVNALRRVLLSFGEKIEKELQRNLQRQIGPEQAKDVQRSRTQSDGQIPEGNASVVVVKSEAVSPVPQAESDEFEQNEIANQSMKVPVVSDTLNKNTTETNSFIEVDEMKFIEPTKLIQVLSTDEIKRRERKRKQMEKQMEFKRRMMEKRGLSTDENKPNPKY